jgi:hypothetical protein
MIVIGKPNMMDMFVDMLGFCCFPGSTNLGAAVLLLSNVFGCIYFVYLRVQEFHKLMCQFSLSKCQHLNAGDYSAPTI